MKLDINEMRKIAGLPLIEAKGGWSVYFKSPRGPEVVDDQGGAFESASAARDWAKKNDITLGGKYFVDTVPLSKPSDEYK